MQHCEIWKWKQHSSDILIWIILQIYNFQNSLTYWKCNIHVSIVSYLGTQCNKNNVFELYSMTRNQIILTKQSGRVTKILTASRILQISIALCQIKAQIHSFPTMYIIGGGGKFGLTRGKKCLKPKRSPKNSCFGGNESQLHNFGWVWDPNFLRWP